MNRVSTMTGPLMISFDVTYKCNFRCLHCYNGSGDNSLENELTDDEIRSVANMIIDANPTVVCFCGGEPLLRLDIICESAEKITKSSNYNIAVNAVTNGSLVTRDTAKMLKDYGFSTVQVSLDGSNNETHDWLRNTEGSFDKAIKAITYLKEANLNVGVAFTPHKRNINQFEDVIKLCKNLGVNDFHVQPLMPLGRAIDNMKDVTLNYLEYKNMARKLQKLKYENIDGDMHFEWGDPVDHVMRFSSEEMRINPLIGINAYGSIYISPYLPISFGNIKKHSLSEYWSNGLTDAWDLPITKELSRFIYDIDSLSLTHTNKKIPRIYYEKSYFLDLIDVGIEQAKNYNLLDMNID